MLAQYYIERRVRMVVLEARLLTCYKQATLIPFPILYIFFMFYYFSYGKNSFFVKSVVFSCQTHILSRLFLIERRNILKINKMSSGFISESEILEARRARQEEWEKVRSEDQPKGNHFLCLLCISLIGITQVY